MSDNNDSLKNTLIELFGLVTILNQKHIMWSDLTNLEWAKVRDCAEEVANSYYTEKINATVDEAWSDIRQELLGDE